MPKKVIITEAAERMVRDLQSKHGTLIFHQSGGCCDGSAPMCFPEGDLFINETDVHLGKIADCDFYMSKDQYEYWKHCQLIIDLVKGRGASFSLEIPTGYRFITKSRLFELTQEEIDRISK